MIRLLWVLLLAGYSVLLGISDGIQARGGCLVWCSEEVP